MVYQLTLAKSLRGTRISSYGVHINLLKMVDSYIKDSCGAFYRLRFWIKNNLIIAINFIISTIFNLISMYLLR